MCGEGKGKRGVERERQTRHGKEHDLLICPLLRRVVVLGDAAGGDGAFVFGVGDVAGGRW